MNTLKQEMIVTEDDLNRAMYTKHHDSSRKGENETTKIGMLEDYSGPFGKGFIRRCDNYP